MRSLTLDLTEICLGSCLLVLLGFLMGTKYYSLFTYYVVPLVARITSSYDHVKTGKKTTKQESLKERDSVLKSINYVVPKHMAVIMDGNRRFARKKYGIGHELRGHRAGGELLHDFIGWCQDYGVKVLTVYVVTQFENIFFL